MYYVEKDHEQSKFSLKLKKTNIATCLMIDYIKFKEGFEKLL